MDSVKIIEKEYQKARSIWIFGIITLVAAVALLGMGIAEQGKLKRNIEHLDDIIVSSEINKAGKIAYLDLYGCYGFATDGDRDYYIAYDEDYYYIISMNDRTYDYAVEKANESPDGMFRLYGWTREIPLDVRSFAIDAANEDAGENYVNIYNFEDFFGNIYLDVRKESSIFGIEGFFNASIYPVFSIFALLAGLISFLLGRARVKSFAPFTDTMDNELTRELESENTVFLDKVKTYLTDHYLVSANGMLNAVKYSDIFWAYLTEHRTNGIRDYDYVNTVTKDGKMIQFANARSFGKKNQESSREVHSQIIEKIMEKNPSVLIGFNSENQAAYNDLRKQLKEDKKNSVTELD